MDDIQSVKALQDIADKTTTGFMQHYNWKTLFSDWMFDMVRGHLLKEITQALIDYGKLEYARGVSVENSRIQIELNRLLDSYDVTSDNSMDLDSLEEWKQSILLSEEAFYKKIMTDL